MSSVIYQARASYALVERNFNLIKRYGPGKSAGWCIRRLIEAYDNDILERIYSKI
jgi:hypothetical protein